MSFPARRRDRPSEDVGVTVRANRALTVPPSTELLDTIIYGSGNLLVAIFKVNVDGAKSQLACRIYVDGNQVLPFNTHIYGWYDLVRTPVGGIGIGVYDPAELSWTLVVTIPFPFKTSIQLGFFNQDAVNQWQGFVGYAVQKIR